MITFDTAIGLFVGVLRASLGDEVVRDGLIVRDAAGRIAFCSKDKITDRKSRELIKQLIAAVGGYVREDRPIANADAPGVSKLFQDPEVRSILVDGREVRLLERRLAGADWLRIPSVTTRRNAICITFASIKGGVGRSTALSVVAADQASKGRRVLAVDLDLEAPGIGTILLDESVLPKFGTLDYLVESAVQSIDGGFLQDMVGPSSLAARKGKIHVAPAFGKASIENPGEIMAKISRAYLDDHNGRTFSDRVVELIAMLDATGEYDVILVDSRAGLHETTAAAILQLKSEVYLFGLAEPQTFVGLKALFSHMDRYFFKDALLSDWYGRVNIVQGKSVSVEELQYFAEQCRSLRGQLKVVRGEGGGELVPLPAEPFHDVPWDERVPDTELADIVRYEGEQSPIAVHYDPRFKGFSPLLHGDLMSRAVYAAAFEELLVVVDEAVSAVARQEEYQ